MKIQRIKLENYRGIKLLEISLNNKSTVFFGENGTGKTSVLNAILIIYSQIINKLTRSKSKKNQFNLSEEDISFGEHMAKISLDLDINEQVFEYYRKIERKDIKKTYNKEQLQLITDTLSQMVESPTVGTPVFINYGVHRAVFDVPLRIRNKHDIFDELVAFENCLNPVTDFRTFFEWYRNQEDIENEKIRDDKNYIDKPLRSVQNAIYTFLPEIRNLKIRRKPRLQMIVTKNGKTLNITQLSDGEKCLLALVGDIARRLAIANPSSSNPLNESSVVLIDEVELHLHTKWQRYIIPNLQKTFPNIQFVISTHSPQVLGEVKDANIFKLIKTNGKLSCQKINDVFGKDSNFILEQFMDTKKENEEISAKIHRLYECIDEGNFFDSRVLYSELMNILTPRHADLVKADILIRRQ